MTKTIRRLMYYEVKKQKIQRKTFVSHHFHTIHWQIWDDNLKRYVTIKNTKELRPYLDRGWRIIEVKREKKKGG